MNASIWRTHEDRWMLLGCTLRHGGFFNFAGLWGDITKAHDPQRTASFTDETGSDIQYYYVKDKGKNWPLFVAFEPLLKPFEFWDNNDARMGTYEQEMELFSLNKPQNLPYKSKIEALGDLADIKLSTIDKQSTQFPPHFKGDSYLYGSHVLALPAPLDVQTLFKKTFLNDLELFKDTPTISLSYTPRT